MSSNLYGQAKSKGYTNKIQEDNENIKINGSSSKLNINQVSLMNDVTRSEVIAL